VQRERGSRLLSALKLDPPLRDGPKQSLETEREKITGIDLDFQWDASRSPKKTTLRVQGNQKGF